MSTTPTTLGKYQIIREIARSNDIVYEAYDPLMNRRVALKELAIPHGSTSTQREERIKRFSREVKAAGSLAHPNLMTVYEVGQEGDRHYMAMEFLDGHTLRNELDTRGFMEPERAVKTAREILDGLEFAHKNGVIHRDIKPDNIQLTESGRVKVTDFGIARLTFEPNLTMDGQVFGTPSYMSPEQVMGREIDARSDIFSVGILLYEMIAGSKPFAGDSIVAITHAIVNSALGKPTQMSDAVWAVVERALQKQPAQRWGSAGDMTAELDRAMRQPVAPVAPPPPIVPPTYSYNPMPPQTPIGPAYGTPYGQPQAPAPGYQPYGQQQPPQYPVYYPPPPREPLFSPETRLFFRRLFVISLLVGSLFALVVVGIQEISKAVEREQIRKKERSIRNRVGTGNPGTTMDERIAIGEESLKQLTDRALIADSKRDLASRYEERGKALALQGRLELAETDFAQAVQYDPDNGLLYTNLGRLYADWAARQSDQAAASRIYQQAANEWKNALTRLPSRTDFQTEIARCYINAAQKENTLGRSTEARSLLERAAQFAIPGSPEEQLIRGG